ncbi:MAG: phosphoribosylamine--glycine ligase [Elusimicrobia bacterium]|nr:phosphoribosylamine--glycine ligase [Elusimicrobiota bacterium]
MKVLIVGSGGREHALGWKIKQESSSTQLIFAPGNAGTELLGTNVKKTDDTSWASLANKLGVEMVIFGPESPLAEGAADDLTQYGFKVFGVGRMAAQLEASKIFAKNFCQRYRIPTAAYKVFDKLGPALDYCEKAPYPLVIKADGLAAGKGSVIAEDWPSAEATLRSFMEEQSLGDAGRRIVVEEFLEGPELSLLAFFDGSQYVLLPPCRDYKRLKDGHEGPNTGGMGVIAPVPVDRMLLPRINEAILEQFRIGLEKEGILFKGVIYFGLMLTPKGPYVLEFNVRFGDPEAQALVPLVDLPYLELMEATHQGMLAKFSHDLFLRELENRPRASTCVVMASEGYPQESVTGRPITLDSAAAGGALVFHAGTMKKGDQVLTNGGRVLSVVGTGRSPDEARRMAYGGVAKIKFEGMQFRMDIGA